MRYEPIRDPEQLAKVRYVASLFRYGPRHDPTRCLWGEHDWWEWKCEDGIPEWRKKYVERVLSGYVCRRCLYSLTA